MSSRVLTCFLKPADVTSEYSDVFIFPGRTEADTMMTVGKLELLYGKNGGGPVQLTLQMSVNK